jgi:hypothetical protein
MLFYIPFGCTGDFDKFLTSQRIISLKQSISNQRVVPICVFLNYTLGGSLLFRSHAVSIKRCSSDVNTQVAALFFKLRQT